jgi:hypothetical protein
MYIKEMITAVLIGSATILPTANGVIMELLTNGDFETGDFTGWELGINGIQTIENGAARISNSVIASPSTIRQNELHMGLLTPGQEVTVSFDYRGSVGIGAVIIAHIYSVVEGGGISNTKLLDIVFPHADPDVWSTHTQTITLGDDVSGGFSFQLEATTGTHLESFADVYFDNISVMGNVIHEPTSVFLILSGGTILTLMRRKKNNIIVHKVD